MAMMISKFHKLIQSRILWGAFLIIIVFSFVIWGMVWPSDIQEAELANAAGTLDGQPVTHSEFRTAYLSTYMARALTLGREITSTPESEAILRRLSWQRLATLRQAAQMGITASTEELVSAIRSNFSDKDRNYNREQYQAFIQNVIRPMGFTELQFEQHVREEIVIQKLGSLIGRQAHVTPLEIRRTFETLLDSFVVEYASILTADVEQDVTVSEEAARQLYDADPAAFTLPEQREVSYAAFPIADYPDDGAEIPEDDILDYYELNIEDYTTTETGEDGQPRQNVADLDEVREGIVAALRRAAALAKADAAATELAFRAIPDRDGVVPDFAAETEKSGRQAQKLAPFSRFEIPLEDAGAAFTVATFELEPTAYDRVSAPIAGEDQVYVIYLEKTIAPRVPSFDEARDQVFAVAKERAVAEALATQAQALQEAAATGLAEGKSFADVARGFGAEVANPEPFTGLSGSSSSNAVLQSLVQAVVANNAGEVAEPVATEDGMVVAYLKARTPADPASFDAYRDEISNAIRNRRAQGLYREWQENLLAPARFTDLQRTSETGDQEEGADEELADDEPAEDGADAAAAESETM